MNTPDFKNAPEGATHYDLDRDGVLFYKTINDEFYYFSCADDCILGSNTYEWYKENLISIPQPAKEDWFSKGEIPPVGVECEFIGFDSDDEVSRHERFAKGQTVKIACHFMDQGAMVAGFIFNGKRGEILISQAKYDYFRPLKSDREKCIDAAMKINDEKSNYIGGITYLFGKLYDAGMLRMREDK